MVAQVTVEGTRTDEPETVVRWHPLTRMVFRFGFVFVGIGMAGTWLLHTLVRSVGVPQDAVLELSTWLALSPLTDWVGARIFGVTVDYTPTGSGDTAAQWISQFTLLLVSLLATAVWSLMDRNRPNYLRLYAWFRLLLRLALMSALLLYGMVKLLPSQMTFYLERLVEPFGQMSPMAVLWAQTSASEPYEMALGAAEVAAALLLVLPVTAGLGSVLALVVAMQVLLLNLTFDVPVKLFAGQLLVWALILAAPELVRLVRALLGHAVGVRAAEPLVSTPRARRILVGAQAVLGIWLLFTATVEAHDAWRTTGNGRDRSPLYGIWDVTEYTVAGETVPALTDFDGAPDTGSALDPTARLRRIIFDIPQGVTAQRMDDSLLSFPARIDTERQTITLSKDTSHSWPLGMFGYQRPEPDRLILTGQLGGRPVRMQLELLDLDRFPVVSRGFHWVSPVPYYR
ncbi:Uncharacterised protein [Nocardia otitidiscaviarum]|uniref:DoxX family protein n=1 Tax=Nocardia otitidiscaviarum TaxID=1823 RepID=A0A378YQP6_9NOCA|nr:DoxX family protein [Nocardia otitidiscaviarum]SUA79444.1 Uncharacterised protein [Nocardia otitidiscaviarum]